MNVTLGEADAGAKLGLIGPEKNFIFLYLLSTYYLLIKCGPNRLCQAHLCVGHIYAYVIGSLQETRPEDYMPHTSPSRKCDAV